MDLASQKIRDLIIVYAPQNRFKPSVEDLDALRVGGRKKEVIKVANLPETDYYEPFEHAKPRKMRKKINKPQHAEVELDKGLVFYASNQGQPAQVVPPEELGSNPLGPAAEWTMQQKSTLPYNIRNYQVKLVENLKRV